MADSALKSLLKNSISDSIGRSIKESITKSITDTVTDSIGLSIQKSLRKSLQEGLAKQTNSAISGSLNKIVKDAIQSNKIEIRTNVVNSLTDSQKFTITSQGKTPNQFVDDIITTDIDVNSLIPDNAIPNIKNQNLSELSPNINKTAEDLRADVNEVNIGKTSDSIIEIKSPNDIADDINLKNRVNTDSAAKTQAEDFIKKNGNNRYKIGAAILLGSALAAIVYLRMKEDTEPRDIIKIEKSGNTDLIITYSDSNIKFCSNDELNVNINDNIVVPNVNGNYTDFEDLKNNKIKIKTSKTITTVPQDTASTTYGKIQISRSFYDGFKCIIKEGIKDIVNTVGDLTGLSKIFESIKKFIPWIVGIIILIILFKLWSYFKSSPTSEIKLISPSNARYYYH